MHCILYFHKKAEHKNGFFMENRACLTVHLTTGVITGDMGHSKVQNTAILSCTTDEIFALSAKNHSGHKEKVWNIFFHQVK